MSFLSVVIATYNRAEILRVTLGRLREQTLVGDRYEVIIVDDGSDDSTEAMVAEFLEAGGHALRYLRHENRGPGYSQNRGILEARGPWVLIIANDIRATPGMLEAHYRAHEQRPEPNVAVLGKVVQAPDLPDTVFLRNWDPFGFEAFDGLHELSYFEFWACNVSVKKQFMLDFGMFYERKGAANEDIELGWRLFRDGGLRLLYREDALGHHYHPDTIDSACARAKEQGRNFDVLTDRVGDPDLYLRCRLMTRESLLRFLTGRRAGSLAPLPNTLGFPRLVLLEIARRLVFSGVAVRGVIMPLIRASERRRWLAPLVTPRLIRGTVWYHFRQGLREMHRRRRDDWAVSRAPVGS